MGKSGTITYTGSSTITGTFICDYSNVDTQLSNEHPCSLYLDYKNTEQVIENIYISNITVESNNIATCEFFTEQHQTFKQVKSNIKLDKPIRIDENMSKQLMWRFE